MLNGKDKVKEEADYITEFDCDNEGVRLFLEKLIK
jgi:hydroxymethylpyrimidine pyrophosphatase-like HAD family hydrolase